VIPLVSASSRGLECAAAIERKTHLKTLVAETPALAVDSLEEYEIEALVVDESLAHGTRGADTLVDAHAGLAVPIYVNLSIHAAERVAQDVNCGLQRVTSERAAATRVAAGALRNELRGEVTAILLNADLAMREPSLPAGAGEKLRVICETAECMRAKLEGPPEGVKGGVLRPRQVARRSATASRN